jgi:hypothetical protein
MLERTLDPDDCNYELLIECYDDILKWDKEGRKTE